MISNQDKFICKSQWAKTRRKGNLRRFVDDAVVETSTREDSAKANLQNLRKEEEDVAYCSMERQVVATTGT
jgi:hypothetical protein